MPQVGWGLTTANVSRQLAIVLDGQVIASARDPRADSRRHDVDRSELRFHRRDAAACQFSELAQLPASELIERHLWGSRSTSTVVAGPETMRNPDAIDVTTCDNCEKFK
jgi:hypothetical protein